MVEAIVDFPFKLLLLGPAIWATKGPFVNMNPLFAQALHVVNKTLYGDKRYGMGIMIKWTILSKLLSSSNPITINQKILPHVLFYPVFYVQVQVLIKMC
jgi:hypothetical protein